MKKKLQKYLLAALACALLCSLLTGCAQLSAAIDTGLGFLDIGIDKINDLLMPKPHGPSSDESGTEDPNGEFMKPEDFVYSVDKAFDLGHITDTDGNVCAVLSAACTDGEYVYIAMSDDKVTDGTTLIVKLSTDGTIAAISAPLHIDTVNDMCYNPRTGKIVAVHTAPHAQNLSLIDPATLTVSSTAAILLQIYAITYSEAEDCYYTGILYGYNYAKLDASFNVVKTYSGHVNTFLQEGIDCDGSFLYFLFSEKNTVSVYSLSGTYRGDIDLSGVTGHAQNIFDLSGTLYIVASPDGENAHGATVYTATRAPAVSEGTLTDTAAGTDGGN